MKFKKGDTVYIATGKDRGATGKVLEVLRDKDQVIVEGMNMQTRHMRAVRGESAGQKVHAPAPIHASNLLIVDPVTKKPGRVGKKLVGESYVRVAKKTGNEIDKK